MKHATAVSLVLVFATACGGGEQGDDPEADGEAVCEPVEGQLAGPVDAAALGGAYDLTLAATAGTQAGQQATGRLGLQAHAEDMQQVMVAGQADPESYMPLFGRAQIDLESVGALMLGDLSSQDPMQPGVVMLVHRSDPVSITLRLGSEANRRDVQRFDGGYTALRVQLIDGGNFYGTWASGVMSQESSGYFCAVRTGD